MSNGNVSFAKKALAIIASMIIAFALASTATVSAWADDATIVPHDPYKHAKDSYVRQAWGPNTVLIHCDWEYQFPASFASKQICQFHEWPLIVMSRPDDYYDGTAKEAYFNWMTMKDYPFGKQYEGFPHDFAEWDGTFTYTGINGTVEYGPTNEAPIGEGTYYVYATVRIPSAVTVLSDATFILGKTFTIEPSSYKVKFDANVPNSASTELNPLTSMPEMYFNSRVETRQLPPNQFILPGYEFDSWNTKEDGSGERYENNALVKDLSYAGKDVTLYARWKPKTYEITYDPGGANGNAVTGQATFDTPGTLKPLSEMGWTYENHRFLGWKVEGLPLLLEDEDDFVNLCGKITAYGDDPDNVELTAQWVENGQIVAVVTKDGEPQEGLNGGFSLKASNGTIFTMPVTYKDDKYVFDPSQAATYGGTPSALPPGEYDLYFKIEPIPESPGIPYSHGYPETSAHITYGGTSAASVVFDYYTVSIVKEPAPSGVRDIVVSEKGGTDLAVFPGGVRVRALDGAKIELQTTVLSGYHFDGYSAVGVAPSWDEDDPMKATQVITLHGQATITAHSAINTYAVRFDANTKAAVMGEMEDQDMVYGEPQNLFANQFIRADANFTGWNTATDGSGVAYTDGQSVENLTAKDGEVVTLYAQWETKVFTISFVDEDGTELQSDVLEYGVLPEYKGKTPSKAADAQNTYIFAGWSPEIAIATCDATYTATYEAVCTITFVYWDGMELQSGKVAKGTTPKFEGAEPVRPADDENTYIFAGWSPEIAPVTGDATYTATYTATPIPAEEYTITFVNWDGATLQSGKVAKGTTPKYEGAEPTRPADKENTYKFAGWTPKIAAATADATYTATYTATPVPPEPIETKWVRLAGDNAFDTMSAIVDAGGFEKGGTVVLASLDGYWDALTAAGIAGLENAPVLTTQQDGLSAQTKEQLAKLAPSKVIVCGGTDWIPDALFGEVAAAAGTNPEVVRLAGEIAVNTAEQIANAGKGRWSDTAIIATAGTFQDALAVAPVAYAKAMPIFHARYDYVAKTGVLEQSTIDCMKAVGITKVYIAGGTVWIPESVEQLLADAGITLIKRLVGETAVETSAAIAEEATIVLGLSAEGMGAANVTEHYDALASAAFCGRNKTVLVLVCDENRSVVDTFVKPHAADIQNGYVFGGTASVSDASLEALKAATK